MIANACHHRGPLGINPEDRAHSKHSAPYDPTARGCGPDIANGTAASAGTSARPANHDDSDTANIESPRASRIPARPADTGV